MKAIIIAGGAITDYTCIKARAEAFLENNSGCIIIAADSGYDHALRLGLSVDLVVGDFDSAKNTPPPGVKTLRYGAEKDFTDTELALCEARKSGAREILFLAATGTRADHTLTNIFMLYDCMQRGEDAQIVDEFNKIRITNIEIYINGQRGNIVSLIPLEDCAGVCTEGLKYPLCDECLRRGEGRGVSNVMTGEKARVWLESGVLLVTETRLPE